MGFSAVHELLRLGRGEKLNELIDQLRPMPGHRVRLLNFVEEERARAQCEAIGAAPVELAAVGPAAAAKAAPRRPSGGPSSRSGPG